MTIPPPSGAAAGQDALWLRGPTDDELASPLFEAIWQAIKGWDIERATGQGYASANGSDVCTILDAIALTRTPSPSEAQRRIADLEQQLADARFSPMGDNHHNAMACPYCNPTMRAPSPSEGVREALAARLSRLEHVVWHLLDDNGDGYEGIAAVPKDDVWLVKLNALLPDEHFDLLVEQDARAALASSTVEETLGGEG